MAAIPVQTLLNESTCYACFAPGSIPELARFALLDRLASGPSCTTAPDAPVMDIYPVFPAPGEYILSWSAVPGATSYWVFVAEDIDFLFQVNDANTTSTSQQFNDIAPATRYARVYAINACGISAYSNIITFNTDGFVPMVTNELESFNSVSTVATNFVTAAYQPTGNALVLAFIYGQSTDVSSVTGNGLTWVLVNVTNRSSGNQQSCWIYRAMGASPTNTALTVNMLTASSSGIIIHIQEFVGVNTGGTNGSGAIYQALNGVALGNITIAPLNPNGWNTIVGTCVVNANPSGAFLEAGWTQDLDTAQTPSTSVAAFIAHRLTTTDNSFTTGTVGSRGCIALEIVNVYSVAPAVTQPSGLANLEVWVRSDTGTFQDAAKAVPCTDGTTVYTWDNMGNTAVVSDFIQATALLRPTYNTAGGLNSKPRITFGGTQSLHNLSGTFAQPFTMVVIGAYTNGLGGFAPWLWSDPTAGAQLTTQTGLSGAPWIYAGTVEQSIRAFASGTIVGIFSGTNGTLYVNRIDSTPAQFVGANGFATGMVIGELAAQALIGDIYEVMFFSRALSLSEVSQIQIYAQSQYALNY